MDKKQNVSYIGSNVYVKPEEYSSVQTDGFPKYLLKVKSVYTGAVVNVRIAFFDITYNEKGVVNGVSDLLELFQILLNDIRAELNWDWSEIEFVPEEGNNGAEDFVKAAVAWADFLDERDKPKT